MMRFNDGSRRVVKVSEMVGLDPEGRYQLLNVFQFKQEGVGEEGRVQGRIVPTGAIPNCFKELHDSQIPMNMKIFEVES